ncbi:MAG: hypothetical protein CVT79_03960 [Alphaproteobacteria bacterium HGW-Alphaproteobacteria-18]|nr:MAG: hypothetical protein CVT79_03960 [Alphaproteobacteria bacterium HGW-Alphaproteobacteria-18]
MSVPAICPVGDDALAVKVGEHAARHALASVLRSSGTWLDVVPGKCEVTVQFDPLELSPAKAQSLLVALMKEYSLSEEIVFPIMTLHMLADEASAPDLPRIAAENGLTPGVFLDRIDASLLSVDMMGFTAGFAYLTGVDARLVSPRLSIPRQRVPAGSVGMITGQLGLYALAGPAGWPIIGRIVEPLFDLSRHDPFTLEAGMRIKLVIER